jgi:2'-5' RNA ligase
MRLFTALWPSAEAVEHLSTAVERVRAAGRFDEAASGVRGFRVIPPERWHLTLCFHGDAADQDHLAERLDRRLRRRSRQDGAAPALHLTGAGVFRGVLWLGVEPGSAADDSALRELVRVAGADPLSYRAHMTVARWSRGRSSQALPALFADYVGPWWTADEIALVASEPADGGPRYRTVHRAAVAHGSVGGPGPSEQS